METMTNNFIEIHLDNKTYKLDVRKVLYVLNKLSNKTITAASDKEILDALKEYKLLESTFLENVNKL